MSKKLLAILGSPRAHGNLAALLQAAVDAAKKAGWETETISLYQTDIGWCRGCMGCKPDGICKLQGDELASVREKLIGAQVVVLASPTYFANVSAPVKNLFDRLVGAVMDDNNSAIPKPKLNRSHKYFLITACNTPFPFDRIAGQSTGCLAAMREFFAISGMKSGGHIVFAGTRNKTAPPPKLIGKTEKKVRKCLK